jgi:3-dehydrosphinganine reductase
MRSVGAHALVTGGSSGIGRSIAAELARLGCHVHLVARRPDRLLQAVDLVAAQRCASTQRIVSHTCDVSSESDVTALFAHLRTQSEEPSIVINSAGATRPGYVDALPLSAFEQLMAVNYFGTINVLKAAVPGMKTRGEGHILNVASLAALVGVFGMSAYCGSKFAVRGLTESVRAELRPHGINVSLLCPPDTDTPMLAEEVTTRPPETAALSESAGTLSPDFVAAVAVRGLQRGQALIVPGFEGRVTALTQRLAPGLVERISARIVRKASRPSKGAR